MVREKPEIVRSLRLRKLLEGIKQKWGNLEVGEIIILSQTQARLEFKYGITQKTSASYLQTLADAGYIGLNSVEDKITVLE